MSVHKLFDLNKKKGPKREFFFAAEGGKDFFKFFPVKCSGGRALNTDKYKLNKGFFIGSDTEEEDFKPPALTQPTQEPKEGFLLAPNPESNSTIVRDFAVAPDRSSSNETAGSVNVSDINNNKVQIKQ